MISAGMIWGTFFLVLLLSIGQAGLTWARKDRDRVTDKSKYDPQLSPMAYKQIFWVVTALSTLVVMIYGISVYPFSWAYHSWQTKEGTVTDVSTRLVGGSNESTDQTFVVNIGGQAYSVTDTRMALVDTGDSLVLRCRKNFNWAGTDSFDCAFVTNSK